MKAPVFVKIDKYKEVEDTINKELQPTDEIIPEIQKKLNEIVNKIEITFSFYLSRRQNLWLLNIK